MKRWLAIVALALTALAGCDRIALSESELRITRHFAKHEKAFRELSEALEAHPEVDRLIFCPPIEGCPMVDITPDPSGGRSLIKERLTSTGFQGAVLLSRADTVVWLDAMGNGQIGDYTISLSLVFDPYGKMNLPDCTGYRTNGWAYYCATELTHGWKLQRSGMNEVLNQRCYEIVETCLDEGGTDTECREPTCPELLEAQGK